ncbi:MAG: bifunctional phosphopantothenoylcysteine decarboxylase/phosphopantothenate--cysteine ligase CoaBC [Bacillota bacterium]|jgi:phosphopantothenoylcysteine decarboxylase/phosphopantothenate--cysteine ligase
MFRGKKITLGITGGIAAYKAAEITSWLKNNQASVQVVMTEAACHFIAPLTLKTLSQKPVALDIMSEDSAWNVPHIDVGDCDLFCVIPATANFLAKVACGLANDILSASLLASSAPVLIAPAMHANMYNNASTQENLAVLQERGFIFVEPGFGKLACGATGQGRLADLEVIKETICQMLLPQQDLIAMKVLVTAGPTRESVDPVRYLSNRSSGKMGYAVAAAAQKRGAEVTLISGPVSLTPPPAVNFVQVESAQEMYEAVWHFYDDYDIVIKSAAVADFRPIAAHRQKIKKTTGQEVLNIEMQQNPDILASLGAKKGRHILVGFAAETENLEQYALKKLTEKNLDLIVANDVTEAGAGFDADTNIVTLINAAGDKFNYPKIDKNEVAEIILDQIIALPHFIQLCKEKRRRNN